MKVTVKELKRIVRETVLSARDQINEDYRSTMTSEDMPYTCPRCDGTGGKGRGEDFVPCFLCMGHGAITDAVKYALDLNREFNRKYGTDDEIMVDDEGEIDLEKSQPYIDKLVKLIRDDWSDYRDDKWRFGSPIKLENYYILHDDSVLGYIELLSDDVLRDAIIDRLKGV